MVTADQAINNASKYLGTRYRLGGITIAGIDCSGLIYRAFSDAGAADAVGGRRKSYGYVNWAKANNRFTAGTAGMQRGDLIVYDGNDKNDRVDHIALYTGGGKAISALINPWGVSEHNINLPKEHIVGYVRPEYSGTSGTPTGTPASTDPKAKNIAIKFLTWSNNNPLSRNMFTTYGNIIAEYVTSTGDTEGGTYLSNILKTLGIDPNKQLGPGQAGQDIGSYDPFFKFLQTIADSGPAGSVGTGGPNLNPFDALGQFMSDLIPSVSHGFYFLVFIIIGLVILVVGFKSKSESSKE